MYRNPEKSVLLNCIIWVVLVTMTTSQFPGEESRGHLEEMFLFPGKESWCDVQPIRQEISWPGCVPRLIPNGVCFGQCFSYSIPQVTREEPDPSLQHCESCKPLVARQIEVMLRCPFLDVREVVRLVDIVEECSCQKCDLVVNEKREAEDSVSYSSSYFSDSGS